MAERTICCAAALSVTGQSRPFDAFRSDVRVACDSGHNSHMRGGPSGAKLGSHRCCDGPGCGWVGRYVMRRLIEQHGHDGMPQARLSSQETRRSMMPIMKTTPFAVAGIVFLLGVAPTGSQERQGVISHPPLLKM